VKNRWSLKGVLSDSSLIKDVKTVVSFLLAYVIAVVSNGLIEDFTPAALISIAVTLGALGTFFSIKIITNEFTDRGMYDEEESNEQLRKLLDQQRTKSSHIKSSVAYDIILKYNKDKLEYHKKEKYEELKNKLELDIKKYETMIEGVKAFKAIKKLDFITKRKIARLKSKLKKAKSKLSKLSLGDIYVKYDPVTLSHLMVSDVQSDEDKYSEARRFKITPQRKIRSRMNRTNIAKTFLFVSFQGAAIAQITSWTQFLIFLGLMTLTLATTALTSYVSTRRYAANNFVKILEEKIERIEWVLSEQAKVKDNESPITATHNG